jgi:hypothetical protein
MILDASFRFNVHAPMSIMLGFSGGARVGAATCFGRNFPTLAGTIQMGAGHGPFPPTAQKNKQIYLLVGTKDSNNAETKAFAKECLAAGHKTVLIEWDGDHDNAPPALVREAIRWQTETFLKTNADKSPATLRLRKEYIARFIKAATDSEPAGNKVATYVLYRAAVDEGATIPLGADVKKDLDEIQNKKMKELAKDKEVKRECDCYNELKGLMGWAEKLPATKAGWQTAPPSFDALAKKYAGTPSAATATAQSKLYADKAAAAK